MKVGEREVAVHIGLNPPPEPIQLQFTDDPELGKLGELGEAVPEVQNVPAKVVIPSMYVCALTQQAPTTTETFCLNALQVVL